MNSLVGALERIFAGLTSLLAWPFQFLPLTWELAAVSVVIGIIFLLLYKKVSSQERIRAVKRSIKTSLYEVVLFRHDVGLCLRAQGRMLWGGVRYFACAIPPILILLVPMLLLLAHMNLRYGYQPLSPAQPALLSVTVSDPRVLYRVSIADANGVEVTPPVRIKDSNEVVWRVAPTVAGEAWLNLKIDQKPELQKVPLEATRVKLISGRLEQNPWLRLLYPDVPGVKLDPSIKSLRISYPESEFSLLGISMHWVVFFAILTIVSGLALSRVFNVEI